MLLYFVVFCSVFLSFLFVYVSFLKFGFWFLLLLVYSLLIIFIFEFFCLFSYFCYHGVFLILFLCFYLECFFFYHLSGVWFVCLFSFLWVAVVGICFCFCYLSSVIFICVFFFLFSLATLHSLWSLHSLARGGAWAFYGSTKSRMLDHQRIPRPRE